MRVRTVHYGIGALGAALALAAASRPDIEVVGALDVDPSKAGRPLSEVTADARLGGVRVQHPDEASWPEADVVLHTTGSHLPQVMPQLQDCLHRGLNVVSSCEELSFPFVGHADLVAKLDGHAREHGVSLLGTGVNPGFVMDTLPIFLSGACASVESIAITRVLDASTRRLPFQQKIGAGLDEGQFAEMARTGGLGHVGLAESAMAVARALGWEPWETSSRLEPIIAARSFTSPSLSLAAGRVAGLRQRLDLRHRRSTVLTMDLVMAIGADQPRDEVEIRGDPPVHCIIRGGLHGDRATIGIMLNAARAVLAAPPGLLTMRDLPPVHWLGAGRAG